MSGTHDLEKNPKDLPLKRGIYLVRYSKDTHWETNYWDDLKKKWDGNRYPSYWLPLPDVKREWFE